MALLVAQAKRIIYIDLNLAALCLLFLWPLLQYWYIGATINIFIAITRN